MRRMRIEISEDDLVLLEGLVLALQHTGQLRVGVEVGPIIDALDEAQPVPELPKGGGLALL